MNMQASLQSPLLLTLILTVNTMIRFSTVAAFISHGVVQHPSTTSRSTMIQSLRLSSSRKLSFGHRFCFSNSVTSSLNNLSSIDRRILQNMPNSSRGVIAIFGTKKTVLSSTIDSDSIDGDWYDTSDDDDDDNNAYDDDDDDDNNDSSDQNHDKYDTEKVNENEFSQILQQSIFKCKESITKKRNSLQKEFDKAKNLEETMKRANLIISNLYQLPPGIERAMVQDWDQNGVEVELVFNTREYVSPQEEADALFVLARKMKRGSKIVEELLNESIESLQIIEDAEMDLDVAGDDEGRLYMIEERLLRSSSKTGFVMTENSESNGSKMTMKKSLKNQNTKNQSRRYQPSFRRFRSPNGCVVLVGKNRRDNEAICFQVAKGNDIWMHARGQPGAHVLLQIRRGSPRPTDECMQFAANLAAFYSDARTERKAPVTTASPKHIQVR